MSQDIKNLFSENQGRLSFMRVASGLMWIVSTIYLFMKVDINQLTWPGFALIALLYGLAFFPKVIQKKYEQFNLHTRKDSQEPVG